MLTRYQILRRSQEDLWTQFLKSPYSSTHNQTNPQSSTNKTQMKILTSNALKDMEVILISSRYGDSPYNPVFGARHGKITGKIVSVNNNYILVKWSNGFTNSYSNDCLELAPIAVPVVDVITLQSATIAVIDSEFISKSLQFSAYDVTSKLRRQVNEGKVVIKDKPYEDVNGIRTQRVTHDDIRSFVRDYMNGVSSFDRRFNGDYIVYQPNATASIPSASVSKPAAPRMVFTPTFVVSSPVVKAIPPSISTALVSYVNGKGARTLKQIQSRFKVESGPQLTVRQIYDLASKAGLRIDFKQPYHSSVVTK